MMKKLPIDNLNLLFSEISKAYKLYMPIDGAKGASYEEWKDGKSFSDALNTVRSPKDFFFPQTENLMDFKTEGKKIEIIDTREECEDFVIFGVRACDVKSFDVLDRVFLSEPVDTYYKNRRDHAVIISMACSRPEETCFCKTFGIDPANPGADISAYKNDGYLYMEANTESGKKLIDTLSSLFDECGSTEIDGYKALIDERMAMLPLASLDSAAFGKDKTNEFFNAPEWKELSESCLGCGTCTFVCPTCQCYDIKDFNTGNGVKRFRCWDSCMYSDFTKMAHGNSRLTQLERFRQRFMHKLVYYPTNNDGLFSCVGCGRCIQRCPINMNIVKVMKKLGGKNNV